MQIHSVAVEFFHADRQTDRHDEVNSRFSQFCERALKQGGADLGSGAAVLTLQNVVDEFLAT
jgi:hypothetical protein